MAKSAPQAPVTPSAPVPIPQSLEAAKRALNAEFCFIERLPGIAVIPTPDDPELHIYSRGEFIQSVCSDRIADGKNAAAAWMGWTGRRKVRNLTYAPGQPQTYQNQLNTWVPSKIKPIKGDLTLWHRYLDHLFQSDPTYRDWFIAWLAYQFQHPGVKFHSAVVFWSAETGTGKSLFGYLMAELFGAHNFAEINEAELHGSFNFWAARKQFVMGEEIKGSNAQKQADFLKSVITRKTVTINTKNTPHYTLPDCINYFFTSNRENAFMLDDTDRRFFVHRLADVKLDADYVSHTLKPWLNSGGYEAILHHLMNDIDLSLPLASTGRAFNPFGPAPQTKARKAMIEANRDDLESWWDDFSTSFDQTSILSLDDMWTAFSKGHRRRESEVQFKRRLTPRLIPIREGNQVSLNGHKRKRLYLLTSPETSHDSELVRINLLTTEEISHVYEESREGS